MNLDLRVLFITALVLGIACGWLLVVIADHVRIAVSLH